MLELKLWKDLTFKVDYDVTLYLEIVESGGLALIQK